MSLLQDLDPGTRWTPRQALQHPFITQQRFTGPFQPAPAQQERGQPMRGQPGRPGASAYESSMSSMYHSPMAAMLATSPEFHAQAHAAAMAALQVRPAYWCCILLSDLLLSNLTTEQPCPGRQASGITWVPVLMHAAMGTCNLLMVAGAPPAQAFPRADPAELTL